MLSNHGGPANSESTRIMVLRSRFGQSRPGTDTGDRGCAINDVSGGLNPRASSFARLRTEIAPALSLFMKGRHGGAQFLQTPLSSARPLYAAIISQPPSHSPIQSLGVIFRALAALITFPSSARPLSAARIRQSPLSLTHLIVRGFLFGAWAALITRNDRRCVACGVAASAPPPPPQLAQKTALNCLLSLIERPLSDY